MAKEILVGDKTLLLPDGASQQAGRPGAAKQTAEERHARINETAFWDMPTFWQLAEEHFGMNVSKLGRCASIPKSTMHNIVNGVRLPNIRELAGLAYALHLQDDVFFDLFVRGYLKWAEQNLIAYKN